MRFENPEILKGLAALPLLFLLLLSYWYWRKNAVLRLGKRMQIPLLGSRFWLGNSLVLSAVALLFFALANPRQGVKMQQSFQESADVFIALDISNSMLATDLNPNRLELSKAFCIKLVKALEGNRMGLILFAGSSFLQMPLSTDYEFLWQNIREAEPTMLSDQGTDLTGPIELARRSFDTDLKGSRVLVLISDGEQHQNAPLPVAKLAFDEGIVLLTVAVGTPEGGQIPVLSSDTIQYMRDGEGNIINSKPDIDLLRNMARNSGGIYQHIRDGDKAIDAISRAIKNTGKRQMSVRSVTEFESDYYWFVLAAFVVILLEMSLLPKKKQTDVG